MRGQNNSNLTIFKAIIVLKTTHLKNEIVSKHDLDQRRVIGVLINGYWRQCQQTVKLMPLASKQK